MDGNKDEALRCIGLAESALASGNKQKALKYIKIAQRLDPSIPTDGLLADFEKPNTPNGTAHEEIPARRAQRPSGSSNGFREAPGGERSYTEEHVKVIREIKKNRDYYAILGVEKTCSVEEIRKAYKKLSLKVHPDKNKAPGAEEAFKSVSRAFKCLTDDDSRRSYDQTGAVDDHEYNEQYANGMRRRAARRRTATASGFYYENEIDPDEIFRSFFFGAQNNVFQGNNFHRARGMGSMGTQQRREQTSQGGSGINLAMLMPLAWILIFVVFAFLPSRQPDYSLQKTAEYPILKVTQKYGLQYFVRRDGFDAQFPQGSPSRDNLENNIVRDYKQYLGQNCHIEMQRRHWNRDYPTPNCDKLRGLMAA